MVTRNLDVALRGLKHPMTQRALWADAVCMNQGDNAEKSKQILKITVIFRDATRLLACLGGGANEERGLQILDRWPRQSKSDGYRSRGEHHSSEFSDYSRHENSITGLVDAFSIYACTDLRDRIFALYSMAPDIQPTSEMENENDWKDPPVIMYFDYS
jgi:hypothetical protein